jgi:hypothetical protein
MIRTREEALDLLRSGSTASGVHFDSLDLTKVVFDFPVDFRGAVFGGSLNLSNAVFKQMAVFDDARFVGHGQVIFDNSVFEGDVSFQRFWSEQFVSFVRCVFKAPCSFEHCQFNGGARFNFASFHKASFFEAHFRIIAAFWHAVFGEDAEFSQCVVDVPSDLPRSADRQTNFSWSLFRGNAAFILCKISTPAYFWRTRFQGNVSFDYTDFFERVVFGGKQTDVLFARTSEMSPRAIRSLNSAGLLVREGVEKGLGENYLFSNVLSLQDLKEKTDAIGADVLNPTEREIASSEWVNGSQKMFKDGTVVSFSDVTFHCLESSAFDHVDIDEVSFKSSISGTKEGRDLFLGKIRENSKDFFISHASEDKEELARPLAEKLKGRGKLIWLDEDMLSYGDSLYESIKTGLDNSKHCIVVLSKNFIAKKWTRKELDLILKRNDKRVLLIWYGVGEEDLRPLSEELADTVALDYKKLGSSIERLADEIVRRVDQR